MSPERPKKLDLSQHPMHMCKGEVVIHHPTTRVDGVASVCSSSTVRVLQTRQGRGQSGNVLYVSHLPMLGLISM